MLKLVFNNGTADTFLLAENVFEYTYNATKTVLKITISENDHTFDQVATLKQCTGKIFVYDLREEDGQTVEVLVAEYNGYGLGDYGFSSNYIAENKKFNAELVKEDSYELRLKANEDATDMAHALIEELFTIIEDLSTRVEALEAK